MRSLSLRKDLTRHLRGGHPWIYSDAIKDVRGATGETVAVRDASGSFVAWAWLDPESPIVARVLSLDEDERLDDVVARRLGEAIALRAAVLDRSKTNAYRLLNGEGDHLPGVVVDLYDRIAVVRFDGAGARAFAREAIVAALRSQVDPACILERSGRKDDAESGVLLGEAPAGEIEVREHGMRMLVDVVRGQKTGAFLDQRENRALVRSIAKGRRVLNLFCYTGGFTLAAALGGAVSSRSVDIAEGPLETGRRMLELNGVRGEHRFEKADAFDVLADLERGRFDLIVVDPPNMAPSKAKLERALRAYRVLNVGALKSVAAGGFVASASCSSHVDETAFLAMLRDAAAEARRRVRIVTVRGAGPDHPVAPGHPEGRYLKFALLAVA